MRGQTKGLLATVQAIDWLSHTKEHFEVKLKVRGVLRVSLVLFNQSTFPKINGIIVC